MLIGSDIEFLEASENARAQPTTNHLTSDTTVLLTVPMHVEHTTHVDFVPAMVRTYQKVQAPVFLFTQNPKYLLVCP